MGDSTWIEEHLDLYAIDCLPDDEHAEMESSLAALAADQREIYVQDIVMTQALMSDWASADATAPPVGLRRRVLADYTANAHPVIPLRRPGRRVAAVVAAAAVAIAVALAAGVGIGRVTAPSSTSTNAESSPVADVLSAPDATLHTAPLQDARGQLTLVVSSSHNQAVAVIRKIANPIPADRSLQLWLVGKSPAPISAGLVDSGGSPPLLIDQVDGAAVVAVTLEPRGGSAGPTTPLLTTVRL